jgi:hypothetical protein
MVNPHHAGEKPAVRRRLLPIRLETAPDRIKASMHPLRLPLAALLITAALAGAAETAATYRYPDQAGGDSLRSGDPACRLLCDGDDGTAVWGRWDVKPFIVDWEFAAPVRVRAVRIAIEHPVDPATDGTHPRLLHLFAASADGSFAAEPDLTLPIPFRAGKQQVVTVQVPDGGLIARRLRTHFEGTNRQIVIGEVTFETEPVDAAALTAAVAASAARRAAPLKPSTVRAAGPIPGIPHPPAASLFGAAGHMLHSDHFYPGKFSPYWRLEYTLPFVQQLGIASMREPIYQAYFIGDDPAGEAGRQTNRRLVEDYIAAYDKAGIQVVICAIFANSGESGTPGEPGLEAYCRWLAGMAVRHPCIEAVELGNEPNLTPFWNHSAEEYVATARAAAKHLRAVKSDLPIVVGSFSGMGGVWMRPDLLKEAGSDEKEQAIHWAKKCFAAGLLEFADGVSTHPYNESATQPEGGVFLEKRDDPSGYEKELADFWTMIQTYNTGKRPLKLYFTELGYEISGGKDAEWQADYLSRLMLILFNSRISGAIPLQRVHWYDLKEDDAVVGASGWGLVSVDATHVRPAFTAYQRIAAAFGETGDFTSIDLAPAFANWPEAVKHYAWRRTSDGALVVAFWRMEQTQRKPVDFASDLAVRLPAGFVPSRVEVADLHEGQARPLGFTVDGGLLRSAVQVTDRAAWLVIHP